MKTFFSFVNKEVRHILRDRRTMLILFGMPLVMMLLFGFAISTDVRNVRLVVVTTPWDNAAQQIVERLDASEYFVHTYNAPTVEKAKQLIRDQKADLAVVFSPRFADHRYSLSPMEPTPICRVCKPHTPRKSLSKPCNRGAK